MLKPQFGKPRGGVEQNRCSAQRPFQAFDLQAYFSGMWTLERKVFDNLQDENGVFTGQATFEQDGDGLSYSEAGVLNLPGRDVEGVRAYLFRFPNHQTADMFYPDGAPLCSFDLSSGIARAEHTCGEDLYQGLFRLMAPDAWLAVWRVEGPNKNYLLSGRYLRQTTN